MQIALNEKIVLVTGASRGIGEAIAREMANAGATVALQATSNMASLEALAKECGNNSQPFQADFSEMSSVERFFREVLTTYGRIDIIVNNAGIALSADIDLGNEEWLQKWNQTLNVNLTALGLLCKMGVNHFLDTGISGILINISSRAAFRGDTQDYLAYAASKGGVVALTKSIAIKQGTCSTV